jgi:lipid-A-disaccharide synthase
MARRHLFAGRFAGFPPVTGALWLRPGQRASSPVTGASDSVSRLGQRHPVSRRWRQQRTGLFNVRLSTRRLRVFISTGEVSGDMHGAALARSLKQQAMHRGGSRQQQQLLLLRGVGGPAMRQEGVELYADTLRISSIGLYEALRFVVPAYLAYEKAKKELLEDPPDVAVLIDYTGPNMALATWFRQNLPGVPVISYIGPQQWIWEANGKPAPRLLDYFPILATCCRCLVAIFPLEAAFYCRKLEELGALPNPPPQIVYVGHPILDLVEPVTRDAARAMLPWTSSEHVCVALMVASRLQEIGALLPATTRAALAMEKSLEAKDPPKRIRFIIPTARPEFSDQIRRVLLDQGVPSSRIASWDPNLREMHPETLFFLVPRDYARLVLAAADLAICKSGTVNLEAAVLGVPQIVLYRLSWTSAFVIRHLFQMQLPYVSAVNVVCLDQAIVPELLQEHVTPERIHEEAMALLENRNGCADRMRHSYQSQVLPRLRLAEDCPEPVVERTAAGRAAAVVWRYLDQAKESRTLVT